MATDDPHFDSLVKHGYELTGRGKFGDHVFTHPEGHQVHVDVELHHKHKAWTHVTKEGKYTDGIGVEGLMSHLDKFHGSQHSENDMSTEIVNEVEQFAEPQDMGHGWYFHGHGMDKNGNHRIKVSKGANRAFSVQTNSEGLHDVHRHFTYDRKAPLTDPVKRSILQHLFKWHRKTTDPKRDKKEIERPEEKQFAEQLNPVYTAEQYQEQCSSLTGLVGAAPVPATALDTLVQFQETVTPNFQHHQYTEQIANSAYTVPAVSTYANRLNKRG